MNLLINTGGGDAPGLNAVIRAVVLSALHRGWKVAGIKDGYEGLVSGKSSGFIHLDREKVRGIAHIGGTILGTKNKGHPFAYPVEENGHTILRDISDKVVENFHKLNADALIAIGGDGSLRIAQKFHEKGIPLVCVPKTIDNDLEGTHYTFGFDTAVMVATEAIDRLHTTAQAHRRVMVVEVMGRYAGWIGLNAGVAGGADVILIPEIDYTFDSICAKIRQRDESGSNFSIVVVAEGAKPLGGNLSTKGSELGKEITLGGAAEYVATEIAKRMQKETRSIVLGHLQRGGGPTHFDRLLALRFGGAAVRLVEKGEFGKMVALKPPKIEAVEISEAIAKLKTVPLDSDIILTARDMGICLGDSA